MTRRFSALMALPLLAALFSGGCELQQKSTPVSPTAPTASTPAPSTSYVGTWASAAAMPTVGVDKCGNFQWKITEQTQTSIAGDVSATCGAVTINAKGSGTLNGQNVSVALSGTASASGFPVCNFSLTGTGVITGDTLPLTYSGTTCFGPVSGTETLKKGGGSGPSTPVTFQSPKPVSPIDNNIVSGVQPTLTVTNAARTGSPNDVAYRFQVSTDSGFGSNVLEWQVPEAQNQTSLVVPQQLNVNTTYFWRARAYEGTNDGPWSPLALFRTSSPQAPPQPAGADEIDPRSITWLSPASTDVGGWRITSTVTEVVQYGSTICVYHTKSGQWPLADVFRDGNGANIEGNIMIVAQVNGRWYGAGFDWLGEGRTCKNMPANEYGPDQIRVWPLDASWPGPRSGDRVGFLVSTPSSDRMPVRTLNERSNIVVITYR